jgi:hypothetical protein
MLDFCCLGQLMIDLMAAGRRWRIENKRLTLAKLCSIRPNDACFFKLKITHKLAKWPACGLFLVAQRGTDQAQRAI